MPAAILFKALSPYRDGNSEYGGMSNGSVQSRAEVVHSRFHHLEMTIVILTTRPSYLHRNASSPDILRRVCGSIWNRNAPEIGGHGGAAPTDKDKTLLETPEMDGHGAPRNVPIHRRWAGIPYWTISQI